MVKKSKEDLSLTEKKSRLNALMAEKNREYKGIVLKYAKDEEAPSRTLFGIAPIDELTGGVPSKRFSIIYGSKGTAKTSLAYLAIAQAQKNKKICAYIDMERSYDEIRAKQFGVNTDDLILASSFEDAEQAMDVFISMCKEQVVDLIVLDSIQAMSPKGEQETKKGKQKSIEDDTMALLARKLSQFFRMSAAGVYKGDVTVILIGQTRLNLGGFIALESLSGGHALQHWSTMTIHTKRGPKAESPTEKVTLEELDEDGKKIKLERIIGFESIIKLEKIKISGAKMEGTETRLPFFFASGYEKPIEIKKETNEKVS